jgi:MoxR-like ATPase
MSPVENAAVTDFEEGVARSAEAAMERIAAAKSAIGAVIFGQERVVEQTLATLLAGGHGLLIGVPGLAKTKLVETLGIVCGLDSLRVQFTPDLMPSDILGSEVMEEGADRTRAFRFIKGPIFAQLLMADEINRASPRTQSALLQKTTSPWRARAMTCRARSMFWPPKIRSSRKAPIRSPRRSSTAS